MLSAIENRLIFRPTKYPDGNWQPDRLEFDDVFFETSDHLRLHGWYCRANSATNADSSNDRTVDLLFHGNALNLADRASLIADLQTNLGIDIFIIDYRGYGKSDGTPSEQGLYLDSRAAYRWLTESKGVSPERILIHGRSLGGAVAAELALHVKHRALALESTFTSMPELVQEMYALPVYKLLTTKFATRDRIREYHQPIFLMHGTADRTIPFHHGRDLFEAANEPKTFFEVAGADHDNVTTVGGQPYMEAFRQFLASIQR